MSETFAIHSHHPDEDQNRQPHSEYTPEQAEALANAEEYMRREMPTIQKVTGLPVEVEIGKGWTTDMESGKVTVDPSFFFEKGYTPEHSTYASLHELMAHVRDVQRDPSFASRQRQFMSRSNADHLFGNILADIHGNKLTHALLPAQAEVGADIYDTRLFPLERDGEAIDYSTRPLHIQFLYKIIRQEMIPGSETPVRTEVDQALEGLRNYSGGIDVIELLTRPGLKRRDLIADSDKPSQKLSGSERFDYQLSVIYPVYKQLLEQAEEEAKQQENDKNTQSGEESGQQSDETDNNQAPSETPEQTNDDPFQDDYNDYFDNKHPEPFTEEQEKQLDEMIKKAIREQQDAEKSKAPNPKRQLDERLRKETGHGLREHEAYKADVAKHLQTIEAMRDVYRSVIQERVAVRRGLSRQSYPGGDLLHPDRLPQTFIDAKSGVPEPEAFTRYEHIRGQTEMIGKTDYIFAFDCSGSMDGDRAQATATTALIMLEALAGMERDIKQAEEQHNIELDLDIRTALYAFNNESVCLKPLSGGLSDKERLNVQHTVTRPQGGTADYLALSDIASIPHDADRRRIVFVVTDGESNDESRANNVIRHLRGSDVTVIGIGIESDAATKLYAPYGQRIDNPKDLPSVLQSIVESTIK